MLVISRQPGMSIMIGDAYLLTVFRLIPEQRAVTLLITSVASPSNPNERDTRTVDLVVDATHRIADGIDVTLLEVSVDKARIGLSAPKDVSIHRLEVYDAIQRAGDAAVRRSTWRPGSPPSLN